MSAQVAPAGKTLILFCCMEFAQGGAEASLSFSDAYVTAPINGVYQIDAIIPVAANGDLTADPSDDYGRVTIEIYDLLNNLLAVVSTGIVPFPYGTVTLSTPYPLIAGTKVRVYIEHPYFDGFTIHETASLGLLHHPGSPEVLTCAAGGGGPGG